MLAAACRLTHSKQLNKLKHTGGDCCTQPVKFEQKAGRIICENNNKLTNGCDQKWRGQGARTIVL